MKLHRVTVTFIRVFDIVRFRGHEKPPHTLFGFEASTGKHHGIEVPGHPRLEAGDTVTALLSKPCDWQTLRGWVNHKTQEVAAPSIGGSSAASAAMFFFAGICLYLTWPAVSSVLTTPFLIGGAYWLKHAIGATKIRKALKRDRV